MAYNGVLSTILDLIQLAVIFSGYWLMYKAGWYKGHVAGHKKGCQDFEELTATTLKLKIALEHELAELRAIAKERGHGT